MAYAGPGERAFTRTVDGDEACPPVAVLDSADIKGRGQCEGAVGVVVEVAALLTLLAVLAVLPAEDRPSAIELVELLELDTVPFILSEGVAFAAGEAIAGSRSRGSCWSIVGSTVSRSRNGSTCCSIASSAGGPIDSNGRSLWWS